MAPKRKELETNLSIEVEPIKTVMKDLVSYLQGDWMVVGGLPYRYYLSQQGKHLDYPLKDLDLISKKESVLSPEAAKKFYISHHHSGSDDFYFQLIHQLYQEVRVDIFTDHQGEESRQAHILGIPVKIPIPEEMYLFKLRDILLLIDHPRGLPMRHIEEMHALKKMSGREKIRALWQKRHKNPPKQDDQIYKFPSLSTLEETVEESVEKKKENIREWERSNPLAPCGQCVRDFKFPLYREHNHPLP